MAEYFLKMEGSIPTGTLLLRLLLGMEEARQSLDACNICAARTQVATLPQEKSGLNPPKNSILFRLLH